MHHSDVALVLHVDWRWPVLSRDYADLLPVADEVEQLTIDVDGLRFTFSVDLMEGVIDSVILACDAAPLWAARARRWGCLVRHGVSLCVYVCTCACAQARVYMCDVVRAFTEQPRCGVTPKPEQKPGLKNAEILFPKIFGTLIIRNFNLLFFDDVAEIQDFRTIHLVSIESHSIKN